MGWAGVVALPSIVLGSMRGMEGTYVGGPEGGGGLICGAGIVLIFSELILSNSLRGLYAGTGMFIALAQSRWPARLNIAGPTMPDANSD
jgi:hypothetical protein